MSQDRDLGRRRRSREHAPRSRQVQVRLSESEREQLLERAAELGVAMPRLLVEAALSGDGQLPSERHQQIAELFEVRRLVATIANNVNQLAKVANTSGQVAESQRLERTLADVDALLEQLREATRRW